MAFLYLYPYEYVYKMAFSYLYPCEYVYKMAFIIHSFEALYKNIQILYAVCRESVMVKYLHHFKPVEFDPFKKGNTQW